MFWSRKWRWILEFCIYLGINFVWVFENLAFDHYKHAYPGLIPGRGVIVLNFSPAQHWIRL